jgi:hypothetical protein
VTLRSQPGTPTPATWASIDEARRGCSWRIARPSQDERGSSATGGRASSSDSEGGGAGLRTCPAQWWRRALGGSAGRHAGGCVDTWPDSLVITISLSPSVAVRRGDDDLARREVRLRLEAMVRPGLNVLRRLWPPHDQEVARCRPHGPAEAGANC